MRTTKQRFPHRSAGPLPGNATVGEGQSAEVKSVPTIVTNDIHPWVAAGQQTVRFGIAGGPHGDWPALRDFAQMVEELGFDAYWYPDHPLMLADCWTNLAGMAAVTRRLRLGSLVSCAAFRNPVLLARTVADVDGISQGRAILGLGAGNMEAEFRAMGFAYPSLHTRHAILAETLEVVARLLRGETVTYQGVHCRVEGATLHPVPVQQPSVPILVGGGGERTTLRLVAQYADASSIGAGLWGGTATTEADVQHKYRVLRDHCDSVGRPTTSVLRTYHFVPVVLADNTAALAAKRERVPAEVLRLAGAAALIGTPEQAVERLQLLVAAGCQYFTLAVLEPDTLRLLAERVVPMVTAPLRAAPTFDV